MNRIIGDLRMSKSSFYYALSSKQELYELCVADLSAEIAANSTIPDPEEFRHAFWETLRSTVTDLAAALAEDPAYLELGRMLYLPDAPAEAIAAGPSAAVRAWLEQLLQVGRSTGAVGDDLPLDLQLAATFALLSAFDQWAVEHPLSPAEGSRLLTAQLAALERLLTGVVRMSSSPGPTTF